MQHDIPNNTTTPLVSFDRFLETIPLSRVTGYRYRMRGAMQCINIAGRWYIEQAEIDRFLQRARAGEFAKAPRCPRKEAAE